MCRPLFTQEELEELRRFDAKIDAKPPSREDLRVTAFIEELLFPEEAKRKEAARRRYATLPEEAKEQKRQKSRQYWQTHREQISTRRKARKREMVVAAEAERTAATA